MDTLPNDLYIHLIENLDMCDILALCSTSNKIFKICDDQINMIKNKIKTTYHIETLSLKQLFLIKKSSKSAVYNDTLIRIEDSDLIIYDIITGDNESLIINLDHILSMIFINLLFIKL